MMNWSQDICIKRVPILSKHSGVPGRSSNPGSLYFLKGLVRALPDCMSPAFVFLETLPSLQRIGFPTFTNMGLQLNQTITEFYSCSVQIILESRIPTSAQASSHDGHPSTSTPGKRSKFNLYLQKSSLLINEMEPWCRGVYEPMVIEIWYLKAKKERSAGKYDTHGFSGVSGQEKSILLERWTIELAGQATGYEEVREGLSTIDGKHERGTKSYKSKVGSPNGAWKHADLYKSMVILLRSIYSTTRLLPSHSLFRFLSASVDLNSRIFYNILAAPPETHESIKKDMTNLCLTPAVSHGGLFRVSVLYRNMAPALEKETPLLSTQIIHDYVGNSVSFQLKPKDCGFPLPKAHSLQEHLLHKKMDPRSGEAVQFDYFFNEDLPFAIDDQHGRTRVESGRLISVKSDFGRAFSLDRGGGTAASIITLLTSAATLRDNQLHLCLPKKTVAEALMELRMYIDSRDALLKCT